MKINWTHQRNNSILNYFNEWEGIERINVTMKCDKEQDKHKETLSFYDNKGTKNTSSTSEKKGKSRDGYVRMYECGKHFFYSIYECECD